MGECCRLASKVPGHLAIWRSQPCIIGRGPVLELETPNTNRWIKGVCRGQVPSERRSRWLHNAGAWACWQRIVDGRKVSLRSDPTVEDGTTSSLCLNESQNASRGPRGRGALCVEATDDLIQVLCKVRTIAPQLPTTASINARRLVNPEIR